MTKLVVLWHVARMGQLVLDLENSRPTQPRFQLQVNPLKPDGTLGDSMYIELSDPELEDEDLRTYIAHAVALMERGNKSADKPKSIFEAIARPIEADRAPGPLDLERLEIVIDYLYAELARRLNV